MRLSWISWRASSAVALLLALVLPILAACGGGAPAANEPAATAAPAAQATAAPEKPTEAAPAATSAPAATAAPAASGGADTSKFLRSEEHTSELQSLRQ